MVYEQLIEEGDLALDEIADVLEGTAARLGRSPASSRGPLSRPGSASQRPGSAGQRPGSAGGQRERPPSAGARPSRPPSASSHGSPLKDR